VAKYKIYRQHNCTSRHRTYRKTAECIWRRAEWITGEGPYACLAHCRVLTVQLYKSAEAAEAAKVTIDDTACGGMCRGEHEIIEIVLP
jgi:hypothetical protein